MLRTFNVELCITDKCNLGCPYCYVANKNKFMTFETFEKVLEDIRYYTKKSGCEKYSISYFGGEPLLNFDLIKKTLPILNSDPMCNYATIISNMTLLNDEIYDFIKNNKVGCSWSFDGLSSNETRPLLNIKENQPYKKILDLYNDKKDKILDIAHNRAKVMIYPGNCTNMVENAKFMREFGIFDMDFSLVRDDIWTEEDIQNFKVELHNLADYFIEHIKNDEFISIGFFRLMFLDSVLGLFTDKRHYGCFACTNGCAVSPDGNFYPCQRFAQKNINKYHKNYDFNYYIEKLDPCNYEKCKKCELYRVCNAGCTFEQLKNNNEPLDSICKLYKIEFEELQRVCFELQDSQTFKRIVRYWFNKVDNHGNKCRRN